MGIRMVTPTGALDKFLKDAFNIIRNEITICLAKLGEECIAKIRSRSGAESWFDQTGNLRSSIGYAVYDYGMQKIQSAFQIVRNGGEGSAEGQKMLSQLANDYSNTYALVVVAGMNYADYVESLKNKDVLASTELWAKAIVDARLERARQSAIDIKDDVWKVINNSPLKTEVSGVLKKTSVRPKDSCREDIVISILANNTKQKQIAYVNVNIYVSDDNVKGKYEEQTARLRKLCQMSFELFDNVRRNNFRLSLTDPNFECGQRVIESEATSEHVINNKVLYQIINE